MNDNLSIYKIWAPDDALWTDWVKPVLFASSSYGNETIHTPIIKWAPNSNEHTAIIVDSPNKTAVEEGLVLAQLGYRPIPLYNGVSLSLKSSMIVDNRSIVTALFKGAEILNSLDIKPYAPPAFLLDSNRMMGEGKQAGKYDNRWCVFPQDMPSASFLLNQGISKIIVRSDEIRSDLSHILCRYQEQGIKIYLCNLEGVLKEVTVSKPSQFKSFIYRFQVILGLKRNATGGFGGLVPEPTQSGSGNRFYGMG